MTATIAQRRHPAHAVATSWSTHRALLSNTASLVGTSGVTSLLGFVFWWVAARLLPVSQVGYGSAAVSAMMLVGTFAMIGLNTVLIGELARRPANGAGLVSAALCASAGAGVLFGAGFVGVGVLAFPRMAPYLGGPVHTGVFLAGCALTGLTLVLDEALIGVLLGSVQLWRNVAFSVLKLVALVGLVLAVHDRFGLGILQAWVLGTALSILPAAMLLRRRGVPFLALPDWRALRRLGGASLSHTWLNNALQAPRLALPLVVTGLVSARDSGAFYIAWTIATLVQLVPYHFTTVLYAIGASDPKALQEKLRFSLKATTLIGLVAVPAVVLLAHPALALYGSAYANEATLPLQLLAIGYFGSILKNHYIALCRVREKITRGAWFATVACVARLGVAAAGAVLGGIDGLAIGIVAIMWLEGLATLLPVVRVLRTEPPIPQPPATPSDLPPRKSPVSGGAHVQAQPLSQADGTAPPVRVCYYLQTHNLPDQVLRLVHTIKRGSPHAVVLISHDLTGPPLDRAALQAMDGVHVLLEHGGYGDFSHLERYFAAIDWLDEHQVRYDWLENLSGQDYPTRPIAQIERFLASSRADAFLVHAPVFEADRDTTGRSDGDFRLCTRRNANDRYLYRYRRVGRPSARMQGALRPLWGINYLQPWLRVNLTYSAVGIRRYRTPFGADFRCYGGWFFGTLSAECARYVRDFARSNPGVVAYFRATLAPEETFLQTVLVNSGRFRIDGDVHRYIDMRSSRHGHPKTLGLEDLDDIVASGAHWARKVSVEHDPRLLDALDDLARVGVR